MDPAWQVSVCYRRGMKVPWPSRVRGGWVRHRKEVRLVDTQFVKPLKSQKNDPNDAEAIGEAVNRPSVRFVPNNSIERQDLTTVEQLARTPTLLNRVSSLPKWLTFSITRLWIWPGIAPKFQQLHHPSTRNDWDNLDFVWSRPDRLTLAPSRAKIISVASRFRHR